MTKCRIVIEQAENGYVIEVTKRDDEKQDHYGYVEPEKFVAEDVEAVNKLVKEHL